MTDGRAAILQRLKTALDRNSRPPDEARARLEKHEAVLIPERGRPEGGGKVAQFIEEVSRVDTTVARIGSLDELPGAVAEFLAAHNLPTNLRAAPSLSGVSWENQALLSLETGTADGGDSVGLSLAFGGVAETGTLVFLSGPDNPTTINFLPPTHIAVVRAEDIGGSYEEIWTRIRAQGPDAEKGKTQLPRTVNWVTGPSRTADIEQTLLLGAHGPQRLHIVVVGDGE